VNIEAFVLRRCYPVPVTFADLRSVATAVRISPWPSTRRMERIEGNIYQPRAKECRRRWAAALKEQTSAVDEIYAVVDGREMRLAVVTSKGGVFTLNAFLHRTVENQVADLMNAADRAGYWDRPHEVRIDLQERSVSHDEAAPPGR
jgi:hypothetical protein